MVTYMKKQGQNPCKDLKRGLKLVQDKLLNVTGPLANGPLSYQRLGPTLHVSIRQRQRGDFY